MIKPYEKCQKEANINCPYNIHILLTCKRDIPLIPKENFVTINARTQSNAIHIENLGGGHLIDKLFSLN